MDPIKGPMLSLKTVVFLSDTLPGQIFTSLPLNIHLFLPLSVPTYIRSLRILTALALETIALGFFLICKALVIIFNTEIR